MHAPDHVTNHLRDLGFDRSGTVHYELPPATLYEMALQRGEATLAAGGPLVARTDPNTGRSPRDRFLVKTEANEDQINWGDQNIPTDRATFDGLHERLNDHAEGRDLFVQDLYAGANEDHRLPVRIVTEKAWHSLFAYNMFIRPRSEVFVLVSMEKELVLIGGTHYAGEIKKSIFSVLNYRLPDKGVLPMHASANADSNGGNVAVFFGLSGTGKTTLSADKSRTLIGDDEHAWADEGVYNFEGGCYAKMVDITPASEPEIHSTTERFGTILENVIISPETRVPDFEDDQITQNTRASYPIHFIENASPTGEGGHPEQIVMLTCDAFGVMPPISQMTPAQAMYHFLSGYTAKIPGTEKGISEPKGTFSTCFGAPFMVRHPSVYAELLGEKIRAHGTTCWLLNTGWTGGPFGEGHRIALDYTRAMRDAALEGNLEATPTETDETFGLQIPKDVEGVPREILFPRRTWEDPAAYDEQARWLAGKFAENFEQYEDTAGAEIQQAGPSVEKAPA
ncbi:MAG: phosphoenolpyruvate carboxykinase (ATP) [Bacteroidetes bacterium QS_9_68_14]|nr:MAG: phosphoenolpyruvate carboxykinase (ATP) [Bacteroidetes bacterium QS_9_68_14]